MRVILRADAGVAGEGRDRDRVVKHVEEVEAESAVDHALTAEFLRDPAGENRDVCGGHNGLKSI